MSKLTKLEYWNLKTCIMRGLTSSLPIIGRTITPDEFKEVSDSIYKDMQEPPEFAINRLKYLEKELRNLLEDDEINEHLDTNCKDILNKLTDFEKRYLISEIGIFVQRREYAVRMDQIGKDYNMKMKLYRKIHNK